MTVAESRHPLHLAVYLGLSAGAYAVGLAAVTTLQVQAEAAMRTDREPTAQAIATLAQSNDRLEARARIIGRAYDQATGAYDRVGQALADVEAQLAGLAGVVGDVNGAALALPDRVALPRVTRAVAPISRPVVHATTAASGG
jgi:hypothetical protein